MAELSKDQVLSGRFLLHDRLSLTDASEIWLAKDQQREELVALKFIDSTLARDADQLALLRAEYRKMRSLTHPGILRAHDFLESEGRHFIVMQYVDGDDLGSLRGKAYQEIIPLALALCDAIAYAHRKGFVHRDLKPTNVLIDSRGACFLTDFGSAAGIDAARDDLHGGGSLPFMSPQQLDGKAATVADDVYGFGALLYELISGLPPLHPNINPDRVRHEIPAPVESDGLGQGLPPALSGLISAMLDKSVAARPAGMAAVQAILEEVNGDSNAAAELGGTAIRPVSRSAGADGPPGSDGKAIPPEIITHDNKQGVSAPKVLTGFAILLGCALVVMFVLPSMVAEKGPLVDSARPEPPRIQTAPVPGPESSAAARAAADKILGELLPLEDQLRSRGVALWGGSEWSEVARLIETGDQSYRERNFSAAAGAYQNALSLAQPLVSRADDVLAEALADGQYALLAGDAKAAEAAYRLAQAIDANNAESRPGLERAARLPDVLQKMTAAVEFESQGDFQAAADTYAAALDIDPAWSDAQEGMQRSRAVVQQAQYETEMAAGYSALAVENFAEANRAFQAALQSRPGDADAAAALGQLRTEQNFAKISALEAEARELESAERWTAAAEKYAAVLALDSGLLGARQGLARARERTGLVEAVEEAISLQDRYYEDRIVRQAKDVLAKVNALQDSGAKLRERADELDRLLKLAAVPVDVRFQSDGLTEVTVYKVGRLGTFATQVLPLRPGRYVAVGSRNGYRDVRREFKVDGKGQAPIVEISCQDPI